MKRFFTLAALGLTALFAFNSCGGNEPVDDPVVTETTLDATTPAEVVAGGGTTKFNITSNAEWTITKAETWLSVTPEAGKDNAEITVTVEANTGAARSSELTIKAGDKTKTVTVTQAKAASTEKLLVDELVGQWSTSGYRVFSSNGSPTADLSDHTLTIEKINETSVRIINLMGMSTFYGFQSASDTFVATVDNDNRTISIAAQALEPTIDRDGWPTKLLGITKETFEDLWAESTGMMDIPVSTDMKIDFREHGAEAGTIDGDPVIGSFVILTKDPSGQDPKTYYFFYEVETVWTKNGAAAPAPMNKGTYKFIPSANYGSYKKF
jgi:hypothetical protein